MKQDFVAKVGAYEEELSSLRSKVHQSSFSGPTIKADIPVSAKATDDKYAELSINKSTLESEEH